MKNLLCSLAVALLLVTFSNTETSAQELQKGDFILNPGLGFGYQFWGGITVGVNGEYFFTDVISGGGYLAYTRWNYGFVNSDIGYNFFDFGVRASYHFGKLLKVPTDQFDPYAGAQVGGAVSSYDYNGTAVYGDAYDRGIRGGLYAGARWYFNEKVGVYGEVGFALCPVMVGATFKF
jgi:hypothetical protein